jgi:hypothetical protein
MNFVLPIVGRKMNLLNFIVKNVILILTKTLMDYVSKKPLVLTVVNLILNTTKLVVTYVKYKKLMTKMREFVNHVTMVIHFLLLVDMPIV